MRAPHLRRIVMLVQDAEQARRPVRHELDARVGDGVQLGRGEQAILVVVEDAAVEPVLRLEPVLAALGAMAGELHGHRAAGQGGAPEPVDAGADVARDVADGVVVQVEHEGGVAAAGPGQPFGERQRVRGELLLVLRAGAQGDAEQRGLGRSVAGRGRTLQSLERRLGQVVVAVEFVPQVGEVGDGTAGKALLGGIKHHHGALQVAFGADATGLRHRQADSMQGQVGLGIRQQGVDRALAAGLGLPVAKRQPAADRGQSAVHGCSP